MTRRTSKRPQFRNRKPQLLEMESQENHPQFRNIKTGKDGKTHRLPEEIIEEILSRLPVKSLLKFRCVSKSWRSLICSKRFVKSHLENSKRNTNLTHHRVILNPRFRSGSIEQFSLYSLMNEPVVDRSVIDYPMGVGISDMRFVGSCNGLICILLDEKRFLLWNPSTRMTRNLPVVDDTLKSFAVTTYGFGFDEANGDYKVFGILLWSPYKRTKNLAKVYSLQSNSWKTLTNKDDYIFNGAGKLVNGTLHWDRIVGLDSVRVIQSFDLEREVFGVVEKPSNLEGDFYLSVAVLDGCLSVICDYRKMDLEVLDIWIMKQYGVVESWNKLGTIDLELCSSRLHLHNPIYIGPNKDILFFDCESMLMMCSLEDNRFWRPEMHDVVFPYDEFQQANVYVESLVSLLPDGE